MIFLIYRVNIVYFCWVNLYQIFSFMISKIILIYFVLINLITFIVWWIDKRKAIKKKWRISEKTLLILTLMGWFVWAVFWMQVFHHKTIKSNFLYSFRWSVAIWFVILWIAFYFYLKGLIDLLLSSEYSHYSGCSFSSTI